MNLLTLRQWAISRNISRQRAQQLVAQGRIAGAVKIGSYWLIPAAALVSKLK